MKFFKIPNLDLNDRFIVSPKDFIIKDYKKIKKFLPDFNFVIVKGSKDPRDYRVNFNKLSRIMNNKSFKTVDFGIKEIINFLKLQKNPKKFLNFGNFIIKK